MLPYIKTVFEAGLWNFLRPTELREIIPLPFSVTLVPCGIPRAMTTLSSVSILMSCSSHPNSTYFVKATVIQIEAGISDGDPLVG